MPKLISTVILSRWSSIPRPSFIFFAVVYTLYLLFYGRTRPQNILLLGASYFFYGYWDWRFLILIFISTIADYTIGRKMGRTDDATPAVAYVVIAVQMAIMLSLTLLGWLIFRSKSVEQLTYFLTNASLQSSAASAIYFSRLLSFSILMFLIEVYQQLKRDLLIVPKMPPLVQASIYTVILIMVLLLGVRRSIEFIYFQF